MARSKVQITPNPNGPTALELVKRTFPGRMANDPELLSFFQNLANLAAAGAGGSKFTSVCAVAATNVANDTFTALSLTPDVNLPTGYWAAGQPTRLTIPTGQNGLYEIIAGGEWNPSGGGGTARVHFIRKNGSGYYPLVTLLFPQGNGGASINAIALDLVAGDYIEFVVYQASGGFLVFNANPLKLERK